MSNIPSKNTNQEFAVGTVLFDSGQTQSNDFWDDADLIDHWDKTVELYRSRHLNKKEQSFKTTLKEKGKTKTVKEGYIKKVKQPVDYRKTNKQSKETQNARSNNTPQLQSNSTSQDDFSNLIMSWYYAGYQTALYQSKE